MKSIIWSFGQLSWQCEAIIIMWMQNAHVKLRIDNTTDIAYIQIRWGWGLQNLTLVMN